MPQPFPLDRRGVQCTCGRTIPLRVKRSMVTTNLDLFNYKCQTNLLHSEIQVICDGLLLVTYQHHATVCTLQGDSKAPIVQN